MPASFILIPGRTARQGTSLNEGKFTPAYVEETNTLLVSTHDMQQQQLRDGDQVRVQSQQGSIVVSVKTAKGDELSPGMLFLAYGPATSQLMGGDTHGTGMPDSKGIDVTLQPLPANPT